MSRYLYLMPVVKSLLVLTVVGFVGYALYGQVVKVDWQSLRMRPSLLALSVLLYLVYALALAATYRVATSLFGSPARWDKTIAAATVPQLLKYIPGKIATVACAAAMLTNGSSLIHAVFAVLYTVLVNVIAGILVFLLLCGHQIALDLGGTMLLFLAVGLCGCIAFLHPAVMGFALRLVSRLMKTPVPQQRVGAGAILKMITLQVMGWMALGLSYGALAASIFPTSVNDVVIITGAVPASVVGGFLALVSPSGLGVREGLMLLLMKSTLGPERASLLAIVGRCWQTALEVAFAVATLVVARQCRRSQNVADAVAEEQ